MPSKDWQDCHVENLLKKQDEQDARVKHLEVNLAGTVDRDAKDEYLYLVELYSDDIDTNLSMAAMFISEAPIEWLTEVFAAFPGEAKADPINVELVMDRFANNASDAHNPKRMQGAGTNLDNPAL